MACFSSSAIHMHSEICVASLAEIQFEKHNRPIALTANLLAHFEFALLYAVLSSKGDTNLFWGLICMLQKKLYVHRLSHPTNWSESHNTVLKRNNSHHKFSFPMQAQYKLP